MYALLVVVWTLAAMALILSPVRRRPGIGAAIAVAVVLAAGRYDLPSLAVLPSIATAIRAVNAVPNSPRLRDRQTSLLVLFAAGIALTAAGIGEMTSWTVDHIRIAPRHITLAGATAVPLAVFVSQFAPVRTRAERLAVEGLGALSSVVVVLVAMILSITLVDDRVAQLAVSSLSVTAAVGLGVPVRSWTKQALSMAFFGTRRAPHEALSTLTAEMTRARPLDELTAELAKLLHDHFGLVVVHLYRGRERMNILASTTLPAPGPLVIPAAALTELASGRLIPADELEALGIHFAATGHEPFGPGLALGVGLAHAGELHGLLLVVRAPGGSAFNRTESSVLRDVANVVGATLSNAAKESELQATLDALEAHAEELRRSRARVVAAADEARRRVERDLHDGAQQELSAIGIGLGILDELVAKGDDASAAELIRDLQTSVRETTDEVRRLAHGIYPPALAAGGLVDALPAAARRFAIPVDFRFRAVDRYSEEAEATIYFCCLEAITNSAKHAVDIVPEIVVEVEEKPGRLCFRVSDRGPGFEPEAVPNHHGGLHNMADRTGALGGHVEITSQSGAGTTVHGWVPLPPRPRDET